jgi:hypothetical protein
MDGPDFAAGDVNHLTNWFGESVEVDVYFLESADVVRDMEAAGFTIMSTLVRQPLHAAEYPSRRCYIIAQRSQ